MTTMNIAEAKAKLSELVARAEAGEEVVIARNGRPSVRLVAADADARSKRRRPIGLWDHLGLELGEDLFLRPDHELIEAAENGRIFPTDE